MNESNTSEMASGRPRRTVPLRAVRTTEVSPVETLSSENIQPANPGKLSKKNKVRKQIAKFGLAALCVVPTADLMLSDAATVKSYEVIQDHVEISSGWEERGIEMGALGGLIVFESVALGQVITKTKKARDAFKDFDEYLESDSGLSKVLTAPFAGFQKLGNAFEKLGKKISERKTKAARQIGQFVLDSGEVNFVGTSTVIMHETMDNNPPSLRRQTYLGSLIAGSWLGTAEFIRGVYRYVPPVRPPLAAIGQTYEALTTVNLNNPAETPTGTLAIGGVMTGLAYAGWQIQNFRERREQAALLDQPQLH